MVVIVEGHGEDASIRRLLERIWYELLSGDFIEVIPWRSTQGTFARKRDWAPSLKLRRSSCTPRSGRTFTACSWS